MHTRSNGKRGYDERERKRIDKKEREARFKWFLEHTVPCMNPTTCTIEGHFHVTPQRAMTRKNNFLDPDHSVNGAVYETGEYLSYFGTPQHHHSHDEEENVSDDHWEMSVTTNEDHEEKAPILPEVKEEKPNTEADTEILHSKTKEQQQVNKVNIPRKKETNTKVVEPLSVERINLLNTVSKVIIGFNPQQPIKHARKSGFIRYIVKLFGKDTVRVIKEYEKLELGGTVAHGQKLWGYHNGTFLKAETQIIAQCFTTVRVGDAYVERAAEALNDPNFANYSILDAEGKVRAGIYEMVRNSLITKFPNSQYMENDMNTFTNTVCYICTRLILNAYLASGSTRSTSNKLNFFTGAGSRTALSGVPRTESARKRFRFWKSVRQTWRLKCSQERNGSTVC